MDEKDSCELENASLVDGKIRVERGRPKAKVLNVLPWMISTFVLGIWVLYLLFRDSYSFPLGTYHEGWATDLRPAAQQIELQQLRFTDGPAFTDDGEMYTPFPGPIRYGGEPGDEVDEAWKDLYHISYFLLTEEEARDAWGPDYKNHWNNDTGGYLATIDVLHTIHCVDRLRKMLYPEHYNFTGYPKYNDENHAVHRDHCINQLRQYIMCSGDITPLPTTYAPGIGRYYVNSDHPHTCRNFNKIKSWVMDRYNGSSAVKPVFN